MKHIVIALSLLLLTACSESTTELRQFVKDAEKVPRRIDPLPTVKPFAPFAYEGFDLPDPFQPRKLARPAGTGNSTIEPPDQTRRREPLELMALEQLKFVGTMVQADAIYALVRADRTLYRVKVGNYLGQNDGRILEVADDKIVLKEKIQDSSGDWTERENVLPLLEATGGKS